MTITSLKLAFSYCEPCNHNSQHPRLEPDRLTLALYSQLSKSPHLTRITLSGPIVVGERIFDGEWPVVEYFDIVLSTATPASEWHCEGTPEESHDDDERY